MVAVSGRIKKWLSLKNLGNGLFFAAVAAIVLVPGARALTIQGLMKVGLFRPPVATSRAVAVPEISFTDKNRNTVLLSSLKGKVVFINFWATWCPPCLAELPAINGLYHDQRNNSKLVFLMVDVDGNLGKSAAFMAQKGFTLPVYASSAIPANLLGDAIPTTIIINKNGEMVYKHEGVANYGADDFAAYLTQLTSEK